MLALFQDCSSDGPGQPSVQETLETKNSFKEKETQDQGSTLCSQTRLSEVRQRHSCMSQSSSTDSIHRQLKKEDKNLQTISLPHKDSLLWLRDLLFQHHTCTHSLNDGPQTLFLNYKYTHPSVSPGCMFVVWEISLVDQNKISQPLSRSGARFIVGTF